MHPSRFFDECGCKTGIDVFEVYDEDLRNKLKSINPKNFLTSRISLPVYKVNLSYETEKGNYKNTDRYVVMNDSDIDEYIDFWIDIFCRDYNSNNPNHKMINCQVKNIDLICEAVLPIG